MEDIVLVYSDSDNDDWLHDCSQWVRQLFSNCEIEDSDDEE